MPSDAVCPLQKTTEEGNLLGISGTGGLAIDGAPWPPGEGGTGGLGSGSPQLDSTCGIQSILQINPNHFLYTLHD